MEIIHTEIGISENREEKIILNVTFSPFFTAEWHKSESFENH